MNPNQPTWPFLRATRRVLCLGAHADDIEIGCGGLILKLAAELPNLEVHWVVFSAPGERRSEAIRSGEDFLQQVGAKDIRVEGFRESFFPTEWAAIKERFEAIHSTFDPDLVLTHYRDDRHQDHRVLSDLAWNTFRRPSVLEYEIPKYDGDLGVPNLFVPLREEQVGRKIELLLRHFRTQAGKHWFTDDLFRSLLRIRGMECGARYAEAFHARKVVLP